ncbi:hypothetical protein NW762_013922 [Fusarium torreyae]|uniref:SnoaL-like domain-containing protein n=1 Tax=Fusarium torreyae TaxID=1237075 RepID=A0A9W8V8B2_9HYPO|nr:hypothetical protein NW762_013922 [Fusarium torreyae]
MSNNTEDLIRSFANSQATSVKAKDPKLVSATLADDCRRFVLPGSFMRDMGVPKELIEAGSSNEQYEQQIAMQLPLIESTSCEIHETTFDSEKRKATVHLTHRIKLINVEEEYFVENLILVDVDESGGKIKKVLEFTDVLESKKYMTKVQELAVAKAQA